MNSLGNSRYSITFLFGHKIGSIKFSPV